MTIAINLAVPDGIALAADTQITWTRTITHGIEKGTGRQFELADPIGLPVGWSRLARKLFAVSMAGHHYSVAVAGAALINNKTPYSIFRSLEQSYAGTGDYEHVLAFLFEGIKSELRQECGVNDLSQAAKIITLNFILAGYEGLDVSRPILRAVGVYSGSPPGIADPTGVMTSWTNAGALRFNCCWVGRVEFVSHIVSHTNPALPQMSGQYSLLTLADAIDYVRFLAEFTADFQRFAVMVPDCGRPVITATLTPTGFVEQTRIASA